MLPRDLVDRSTAAARKRASPAPRQNRNLRSSSIRQLVFMRTTAHLHTYAEILLWSSTANLFLQTCCMRPPCKPGRPSQGFSSPGMLPQAPTILAQNDDSRLYILSCIPFCDSASPRRRPFWQDCLPAVRQMVSLPFIPCILSRPFPRDSTFA